MQPTPILEVVHPIHESGMLNFFLVFECDTAMNNAPNPTDPSDEVNQLRDWYKEVTERIQRDRLWLWRDAAGSRADAMLRSQSEAVNSLADPSPTIRFVALQVLTYHWEVDAMIVHRGEVILRSDPDVGVRCQAVNTIERFYPRSNNSRIMNTLAEIVRNENDSNDLRAMAYRCLLVVSGQSTPYSELTAGAFQPLRFPDDVDWSLVDRVRVAQE
jgi:hypothetical protein